MGWSVGYDRTWKRDIGYGVHAICDHPGCDKEIDRGLAFVCGSDPYGGEHGCGLYFCAEHLFYARRGNRNRWIQLCSRCQAHKQPFPKKLDTLKWIAWKLSDPSWDEWRKLNPDAVTEMHQDFNERSLEVSLNKALGK